MRITRSTLRRLIAEESARLLAEAHDSHGRTVGAHHRHGQAAAFVAPPEEEDFEGTDDYFGDEDPFGDDAALAQGIEYGPDGYDMVQGAHPEDDIFDEVDVEYGDDGFDMTEGEDTLDETDDDGTFGGPPRVDYDGQYTSPQFVKGTPQHRAANRGPSVPSFSQGASRGHAQGGGNDYSEYDSKHYGPGINENLNESRWAQLAGILKG